MLLLSLLAAFPPQSGPAPADPAITRADLEACVRFLASDELAGREVGSAEAMLAADFLARGLRRAGVKPAGDEGTYLQRVPLTRTRFDSVPKLTVWDPSGTARELVCGVDFDLRPGVPSEKRLRVRVVRAADEMLGFSDEEVALFLDGSRSERGEWLGERRGAGFGLLITPGPSAAGSAPDTRPPAGGLVRGEIAALPPATVVARGSFLEALRAGSVKALRLEGEFRSEAAPAANVVGVVPGAGTAADRELAREAIVFSAHYDHIGLAARPEADQADVIFNGADDDASGCAAVLELAEALAATEPARTLVFFFATGEERGLLGTYHQIEHPAVPLERTVCNLNFEMIGRPDDLAGGAGKLWLTGDERSNLGAAFRELGLAVVADPRPRENFFLRSDNIAYARRGIVAQTLSSYNLHADYHRVDDEVERIDFAHMETAVRTACEAARALADGRIDPRWNPGGDPSQD
jgi:hypothetical protein